MTSGPIRSQIDDSRERLEQVAFRSGRKHLSFRFVAADLKQHGRIAAARIPHRFSLRNVERNRSGVVRQPITPRWKIFLCSDPNLVRIGIDSRVEVFTHTQGKDLSAFVNHKPWWAVVPSQLSANLVITRHRQ